MKEPRRPWKDWDDIALEQEEDYQGDIEYFEDRYRDIYNGILPVNTHTLNINVGNGLKASSSIFESLLVNHVGNEQEEDKEEQDDESSSDSFVDLNGVRVKMKKNQKKRKKSKRLYFQQEGKRLY